MGNSYYGNILEEELKNKVAKDLFFDFDTTQIIGRIDFCVSIPADPLGLNEPESLLWAEAKKGRSHDIYESFIQLILTLGKERPQDTMLPPAFLGAFDAEKIPFTEIEVDTKEKFDSNFMSDYIKGKSPQKKNMTPEERKEYENDDKNYHQTDAFDQTFAKHYTLIKFSPEAQAVMDAGRELWRYYHQQPNANPNASFYDIRLYFQGTKTTKSGKLQMNTESNDPTYAALITDLRTKMKVLAQAIEPKVYDYGFLKK